jgi:hypothetical protein
MGHCVLVDGNTVVGGLRKLENALSDKIRMLGNFDQDTRATNTDAPRFRCSTLTYKIKEAAN